MKSVRNVLIIAPSISSPSAKSLAYIVKGTGAKGYIAGFEGRKFSIRRLEDFRSVLSLPVPSGVLAFHVFTQILYLLALILALRKNIKHVVLSQFVDYPLLILFLAKVLRMKLIDFVGGSRPVVLKISSLASEKLSDKIVNFWGLVCFALSTKLADKLVFISSVSARESVLEKYLKKAHVAWNFPMPEFYELFKLRKEISEREKVVGFVGRLTAAKGVPTLIRAIPRVLRKDPEVRFLFIGSITEKKIERALTELRRRYPENVFYIGPVPHSELVEYYNRMKMLVLPSVSEGVPHVVLEALACGTPVVATRVGGIHEVFGENGVVYISKRDSDELASTILTLLSSPTLATLSSKAYDYVRRNIIFQKAVKMWKTVLEC